MKSKKNKAPVAGLPWRIARRVTEQIASAYPYIVGLYLLCLFLSDLAKSWQHAFNWSAMDVLLAAFSLAALIGRPAPEASSRRSFYGRTLVAAGLVGIALAYKIDPYSFLTLLFGIGVVIYRRIESKFALAVGVLLLAAAPVLDRFGKEYLTRSVTVLAFYFLVILVLAAVTDRFGGIQKKEVTHT